jgi:hypothetical protein
MANEFKHKDPGGELTQAEFVAACGDGHIFACQATGDIVYASSATVLSKLARGAANTVLSMGGSCIPAWTASPSVTDLTIGGGCITLSAATDIDLLDNNASALSFDASGKTGIIDIVTTNCSEGVTMSGTLGVTGVLTATGGLAGGAICIGSSTITTTGLISGGSLDIDNVLIDGTTIGHTCDTDLMTVGNACLTIKGAVTVGVDDTGHDVKFFGAAAGAYMLYDQSCDQLEIRGASADATTSTGKLLLSTSLTNVNANDVIGSINFQAPAEAGGTDAITIAAGIRAVAQATFTCAVNATDLIFYTGHSEAATEKFRFTSQNEIGIAGANYGTDGQVLTSGGAGAAAAWEDVGGVVSGGTDNAILRADGTGGSTSQGSAVTIADTTGDMTFPAAGQIFVGDGNAANPSYSFISDTNAGITIAECGCTAFVHNGVYAIRACGHNVFIGNETANAKITRGLTINQQCNDDELFALKSSVDVAHGMTSLTETDTMLAFAKGNATLGEIVMHTYSEGVVALHTRGYATCPQTTDTTSSKGVLTFQAYKKSGTANAALATNENAFSVAGGSVNANFLIKGNGDLHGSDTSISALDTLCDVGLIRTLETTTRSEGMIKNKWDDLVHENIDSLIDAGLFSVPPWEGGLLNYSQLWRLHSGAIWQLFTEIKDQSQEILGLRQQLTALEGN